MFKNYKKDTSKRLCTNSTDYSKVYIINYEQFFLSYEPLNLKVDINQNFEVYLKNWNGKAGITEMLLICQGKKHWLLSIYAKKVSFSNLPKCYTFIIFSFFFSFCIFLLKSHPWFSFLQHSYSLNLRCSYMRFYHQHYCFEWSSYFAASQCFSTILEVSSD